MKVEGKKKKKKKKKWNPKRLCKQVKTELRRRVNFTLLAG